MRTLTFCLVLALAALLSRAAAAQPAWCANIYDRSNLYCDYYTLQQCQATVSGVGGYCIPNPYLAWMLTEPRRRGNRAHRYR